MKGGAPSKRWTYKIWSNTKNQPFPCPAFHSSSYSFSPPSTPTKLMQLSLPFSKRGLWHRKVKTLAPAHWAPKNEAMQGLNAGSVTGIHGLSHDVLMHYHMEPSQTHVMPSAMSDACQSRKYKTSHKISDSNYNLSKARDSLQRILHLHSFIEYSLWLMKGE